jgi:hypothetical protein
VKLPGSESVWEIGEIGSRQPAVGRLNGKRDIDKCSANHSWVKNITAKSTECHFAKYNCKRRFSVNLPF